MPFAKLDNNKRIVAWSHEKLNGFDVEFSNGDYVDANCVDGLEDFIIIDDEAVYSPKPEKEMMQLQKKFDDSDYICAKGFELLAESSSIEEMFATLQSFVEEYGDKLAERKIWRKRINELEQQIAVE